MEKDTKNYNKFLCEQNNFDKIDFHLFQTIQSKEKMKDTLFELAYFYDVNFVGNKDFIHIPNISNIIDNTIHYPIIKRICLEMNIL